MLRYIRPQTLAEALAHLESEPVVVAGATDLIPARTQRHAWGQLSLSAGEARLAGYHRVR